MLPDTEKEILLNWQLWKVHYDVMTSMDVSHEKTIKEYFAASDQLKTIGDERIAALVKAAYEEMPNVELTIEVYEKELKPWKARIDAAQEQLLTISFEFGSRIPRA